MNRLPKGPVGTPSVAQGLEQATRALGLALRTGLARAGQTREDERAERVNRVGVIRPTNSFRLPGSPEPTFLSKPAPDLGLRRSNGPWRRPAIISVVFIMVALLAIPLTQRIIRSSGVHGQSAGWNGSESPPSDGQIQALAQVSAEQAKSSLAKLVVDRASPRRAGEAIPLGVSVRGADDHGLILVRDLANGMTLSTGGRQADNNWWLSLTDLSNAAIRPPPNFVGASDVIVELRLANTLLSDRQTLHFEWIDGSVLETGRRTRAMRHLSPEEIAALLKRGDSLMLGGDFAAARLVLRRAAEAGDAGAALTLAETYDPAMLEKFKVHGFTADAVIARRWYEKANELGSADAPRRLEVLAGGRD
jgi:hypothetical protein